MNARRRSDHHNDLVFLPLGGTGEIGMNCYCYGTGPSDDRQWLMVDLGVKFGEETDPGIDVDPAGCRLHRQRQEQLAGPRAHPCP